MLQLKILAPNWIKIIINQLELFFSYETCVAIRSGDMLYKCASEDGEKWSITTQIRLNTLKSLDPANTFLLTWEEFQKKRAELEEKSIDKTVCADVVRKC